MFNRILDNLTLSSETANNIFQNIRCDGFNGDRSFTATLRALLHPRIGENEVRLRYTESSYSASSIQGADANALVQAVLGGLRRGWLYVHSVRSSNQRDREAFFTCFDSEENGFIKQFPDFREMTNIRDFSASNMNARFYTCEERHITIIIVESLNTRKWHYIQSFIPRYFKWYFDPYPISEEEKNLLASLIKRSSDDYEKLIEEIASKFDMRSYLIDTLIGNLEKNSRRQQLDSVDRSIRDIRSRLDQYLDQYRDALQTLDELNLRRLGICDIINGATTESELTEYLKANKSIDVIGASGSRFEFIVHTYLDSWDPEMFDSMVNRHQSNLYIGYDIRNRDFTEIEPRKKLFTALFSDSPTLRIRMCGYYCLDLRGDSTSSSGYNYPRNCDDMIPNPHLQRFNCLGNHQRAINSYLRNGDTVGAVEQCVGSCKSMNFAESPTFHYFFRCLFETRGKVIELPDHTCVTPSEALKWLNEQEENKNEEAHQNA